MLRRPGPRGQRATARCATARLTAGHLPPDDPRIMVGMGLTFTMNQLWTLLAPLALLLPWEGCGGRRCAAIGAAGLTITVEDNEGRKVCDATVEAVDGAYMERLERFDCAYSGAAGP